jgi:hypothetical protein
MSISYPQFLWIRLCENNVTNYLSARLNPDFQVEQILNNPRISLQIKALPII